VRGVRTAVLPAAGLGTRLLPATRAVPNELFPVGGRPAIEWALSEAAEAGIERVVIVSSPRKSAIEAYLEREVRAADGPVGPATEPAGPRPFPRVTVVHQLTPAGLGDAVRVGRAAVGTEPFAVLLPDEILLGGGRLLREMLDGYERTGRSQVSLLSVEPDEISSYGCAELAPGLRQERHVPVAGCVEKPMPAAAPSNYALSGRYVLGPDALNELDALEPGVRGEVQLTDALDRTARRVGLDRVEVRAEDGRLDVGNWQGWLEANVRLLGELAEQPAQAEGA